MNTFYLLLPPGPPFLAQNPDFGGFGPNLRFWPKNAKKSDFAQFWGQKCASARA